MDHKDLHFTRTIDASVAHVFHCMTDPSARMAWNAPGPDMPFNITAPAPVAVGNRESGIVGPVDAPMVTVHTDWVVTDADGLLVYAETLEADGMTLTTSLASATLEDTDGKTNLTLHVHVTSFTGPESVAEVEEGWNFAVAAMTEYAVN